MLKVLADVVGPDVASRMAKEKVGDLARRMERWFTNPANLRWLDFNSSTDELLPEEKRRAIAEWAPAMLRRTIDDKPDFDPVKALDTIYHDDFIDEEDEAEPEPSESEGEAKSDDL
jgi:hypothetical protein